MYRLYKRVWGQHDPHITKVVLDESQQEKN